MSKNKIGGKEGGHNTSGISFKAVIGVLGIGGALYGLVTLFQPPADLVPYNEFKKTEVSAPNPSSKPESNPEPKAAERSDSDENPSAGDDKLALMDPDKSALEPVEDSSLIKQNSPSINLPRETLVHLSKGMEMVEKGKYNLAEMEFEKAADLSPNSPEVFSIWGTALKMQKKYKGANKRFARAYELAPEDEEIVFNWAMSKLFEKDADGAIDLFKKALKLNPKNHLTYNYLGKAYGLKKNYPNEEANYVKALEIKEDFAQGHFNLGIVRSLQKKFEEAAPHFTRAIELDKQYEKPFVVQFLTAMGLKKKDIGPKEAKLKPTHPKKDKKDETAKTEDTSKKAEGSDHNMDGSDTKITSPITRVKGRVTINDQPVDGRGVVILETKSKLKVPKQTAQKISIFQRNLQFEPAHAVVMVGSTITFINDDREVHNIYSKSMGNQFNLGAMAAGSAREFKLGTPGPVILRCNLHKDMMGTLFVVPNGYYAATNANGEYELENVKSQEYILEFWHPQMYPEEVEKTVKSIKLTGEDATFNFKITSASQPGEIHDLVDATDYNAVVDNIEKEMMLAIKDWESGKKYSPRKRMLKAITQYYDGEGLKGAIAKSFSDKRSLNLERQMDEIRKQISGLSEKEKVTVAGLKLKAERIVAQLRNNVKELEHRLNPQP